MLEPEGSPDISLYTCFRKVKPSFSENREFQGDPKIRRRKTGQEFVALPPALRYLRRRGIQDRPRPDALHRRRARKPGGRRGRHPRGGEARREDRLPPRT